MTELDDLKNLGPTTREWLHEIGIFTLDDLRAVGVVETYKRLKRTFPTRVTLNALWGLEGAVQGIDYRAIPTERKAELRHLVEQT